MTMSLIEQIDRRIESALESGALEPIHAESCEVVERGMRFTLRWVSTLANKDAATPATTTGSEVTMPGGPRDPDFNPFLNPDPALTVGPIGEMHTVILNKFPVCERHLVLARQSFEEQLIPLAECDFIALGRLMCDYGGLGFYNGGAAAGASQRHKHVQWIPEAEGNASLDLYLPGLPAGVPALEAVHHASLGLRHCFVRVGEAPDDDPVGFGRTMHAAFERARVELSLGVDEQGLLPAFNLLVGQGWMLVVPRSVECFEDVSVAAINFGGVLYVRRREQLDRLRAVGPLAALASVGDPAE